jgi:hypothetical protein
MQENLECQYFYIKDGVELVTPSLKKALEATTESIIKVRYGDNTTAELEINNLKNMKT